MKRFSISLLLICLADTHTLRAETAPTSDASPAAPNRIVLLVDEYKAIPMFANDGTMPVDGAEKEWRVLSEFNPKAKAVKLEQTYTNKFVNEALQKYR